VGGSRQRARAWVACLRPAHPRTRACTHACMRSIFPSAPSRHAALRTPAKHHPPLNPGPLASCASASPARAASSPPTCPSASNRRATTSSRATGRRTSTSRCGERVRARGGTRGTCGLACPARVAARVVVAPHHRQVLCVALHTSKKHRGMPRPEACACAARVR